MGGPPGLAAAPPPTLTAILSEQYWRKDSPRKTSELLKILNVETEVIESNDSQTEKK